MGDKEMFDEVRSVLDRIPIDFGGGCSLHKASVMAWLIRAFDVKTSLDIGVYRGRSLFPQAVAHRHGRGGVVYGVDPWSAVEASEHDNVDLREKIDEFVKTTDFEAIYRSVDAFNGASGLSPHCVLVRDTSSGACGFFDREGIRFGLIHVDGNHDTSRVMEDLDNYLPRLDRGGFVVLDDVSWASVKPALERLGREMRFLYKRVDERKGDDFAVFWDEPSALRRTVVRARLALAVPR